MGAFENRIGQARRIGSENRLALLQGYQIVLTPDQQVWAKAQPEHRMVEIARHVETRLAQAKLISNIRDPISMVELFEHWKTERKPATHSAGQFRRAMDLFLEANGELTFKIQLQPMRSEQLASAFKRFFNVDPPVDVCRCKGLTVGDFALVQRKARLLGVIDPHEVAQLLGAEAEAKLERARPIGYLTA